MKGKMLDEFIQYHSIQHLAFHPISNINNVFP